MDPFDEFWNHVKQIGMVDLFQDNGYDSKESLTNIEKEKLANFLIFINKSIPNLNQRQTLLKYWNNINVTRKITAYLFILNLIFEKYEY